MEEALMEALLGAENISMATPLMDVWKGFRQWTPEQSGKVYARLPYAIDIR